MKTRMIQARVPEEVHLAAVIASTKLQMPLRDMTAEALEEWLVKRGYFVSKETPVALAASK